MDFLFLPELCDPKVFSLRDTSLPSKWQRLQKEFSNILFSEENSGPWWLTSKFSLRFGQSALYQPKPKRHKRLIPRLESSEKQLSSTYLGASAVSLRDPLSTRNTAITIPATVPGFLGMVTLIFPPLKQKRCTRNTAVTAAAPPWTNASLCRAGKWENLWTLGLVGTLGKANQSGDLGSHLSLGKTPSKKVLHSKSIHGPLIGTHLQVITKTHWTGSLKMCLEISRNQKGKWMAYFFLGHFSKLFGSHIQGLTVQRWKEMWWYSLGRRWLSKAVHYPPWHEDAMRYEVKQQILRKVYLSRLNSVTI